MYGTFMSLLGFCLFCIDSVFNFTSSKLELLSSEALTVRGNTDNTHINNEAILTIKFLLIFFSLCNIKIRKNSLSTKLSHL